MFVSTSNREREVEVEIEGFLGVLRLECFGVEAGQ